MAQNKTSSGAEINQCFTIAVIAPIRPGASERWRRYLQELMDSTPGRLRSLAPPLGDYQERAWLIETVNGVVVIMAVTTTQPEQVVERMAAGDLSFERHFREQLLAAQGVDLTHLSTQPLVELVFDWFGPTEPDAEGGEDET